MTTVTASAPNFMQHEFSTTTEQAEADAQRVWEKEMELTVQGRGRTRSRSFLANDESEARNDRRRRGTTVSDESETLCLSSDAATQSEEDAARNRRRSCSFSALQQPQVLNQDIETEEDAAKRAASLSKIYLAGSAPVDVSKLQNESKIVGVKKVQVVQPTGALSAAALDALSEGLQLSVDNSLMPLSGYGDEQLTEEELEEKKWKKKKIIN
ncbi:unnamed protein product [Peronospora destructor]|uniref:Uncharacterized protein n=1 Tax=Peronospora destructor TaxID=86335 RepID=A0AAV0UGK9_9STRA|nr:unnamed protein product [Peronospora destructor]